MNDLMGKLYELQDRKQLQPAKKLASRKVAEKKIVDQVAFSLVLTKALDKANDRTQNPEQRVYRDVPQYFASYEAAQTTTLPEIVGALSSSKGEQSQSAPFIYYKTFDSKTEFIGIS